MIAAEPSGSRPRHRRAKQQTQSANVSTESIESIASQPSPAAPPVPAATCAACGAPLADDQRYCLQCGERAMPMSSVMLAGTALGAAATQRPAGPGAAPASIQGPPGGSPPARPGQGDEASRGNAVTVIAGVGVLLLAMGIGVLIGRSSGSGSSAPSAPQVISVASTPAAGTAPAASEPFTSDWPAGEAGYTVQLQALPLASTQASAVEAAKSAAEGKGAKSVGALKSDEFAELPAGSYIVYSGKYAKKAEAQKALGPLKQSFPEAKVLRLGSGSGASGGRGPAPGAGSSGGSKSGVGETPDNPAPPSAAEGLKGKSGKSYEEQSKNLPNVVSTG